MNPSREIARLIEIMAALRTPGSGCPWDLEQDFHSIAPYTIEEAYEVADAIDRGDMGDLKLELGDLLLQSVYHARIAEEKGHFDFGDVIEGITAKMIRRHPHVFGGDEAQDAEMAKGGWEKIKRQEKAKIAASKEKAGAISDGDEQQSLLDDVPGALPGLIAAVKLQQRAGQVGFDWNDPLSVIDKIREELDEIVVEITQRKVDRYAEEVGDLLFAVANLARHLGVEPESALRSANTKFRRRFKYIESNVARTGATIESVGLSKLEALWREAKSSETSAG
jgi:nucleoside triphosphate diphosphatase